MSKEDNRFRIARPCKGVYGFGVEFLLTPEGDYVEFKNRKECVSFCKKTGLDEKHIWEYFGEDNLYVEA